MERWVCPVSIGLADADVKQLYPAWAAAGTNPATATNGQQIRTPIEGILFSLQLMTDGTNSGILELYDISGIEIGADVSSATAITDTQLDAAITAGKAKLIYNQNFLSSPTVPLGLGYAAFQKGLAARAVGATGTVTLNLVVEGGYRYTTKVG